MRPDVLLPVLGRRRGDERLDWPQSDAVPGVAALVAAAEAAPPGALWLSGGEPTLRKDLPQLIEALPAAGFDTDGLALRDERVARSLRQCGLKRVRIALHSGHAAAHDWLVGLPGAARGARTAVAACRSAGLEVHGLLVPTRPTMEHLPETVSLLLRLGVRALRIRRLRRQGPARERFVTLSPRLGLLEPYLEAAVERALTAGCAVVVEGFPHCAAPRVAGAAFGAESRWVAPAGWPPDALPQEGMTMRGCGRCADTARCRGAPADYVGQFGRAEIDSEQSHVFVRPSPCPPEGRPAEPPERAGRAPATRVRTATRLARFGDLGGDPLAEREAGAQPPTADLCLRRDRSRRSLRQDLVRLAQDGAVTLRVTGDFTHPDALAVVRDALRFRALSVHLEGDLGPLATWAKRDLFALRRVALARALRTRCPGAAKLAAVGVRVEELQTG